MVSCLVARDWQRNGPLLSFFPLTGQRHCLDSGLVCMAMDAYQMLDIPTCCRFSRCSIRFVLHCRMLGLNVPLSSTFAYVPLTVLGPPAAASG